MGSGHFPEEGYRKSPYIRQIKVVTDRSQDYVDPEDDDLKMYIDKPYCYNGRQVTMLILLSFFVMRIS